jgi:hypothetical protein
MAIAKWTVAKSSLDCVSERRMPPVGQWRRLLLSLLLKDNVVGFSRSGKESIFSLRLALELQTVLQNHLGKKKKGIIQKRQPSFPFPCCNAGVTCTLTTERKRARKKIKRKSVSAAEQH